LGDLCRTGSGDSLRRTPAAPSPRKLSMFAATSTGARWTTSNGSPGTARRLASLLSTGRPSSGRSNRAHAGSARSPRPTSSSTEPAPEKTTPGGHRRTPGSASIPPSREGSSPKRSAGTGLLSTVPPQRSCRAPRPAPS
jgi:hypothetical protein